MSVPPRYPVVVFDLDGTLVRNTSVLIHLAERMGHGPAIAELERRFRAHEMTNRDIADASAAWFAGLHPDAIWDQLEMAPRIAGIEATVTSLLELGCDVLLATITWRFVAELLQRQYAFHDVCGTEMGFDGESLSGEVTRYFDAHGKPRFAEAVQEPRIRS